MLPTRRTSLSAPAAAVQAARGLLGPLLLYKWTLVAVVVIVASSNLSMSPLGTTVTLRGNTAHHARLLLTWWLSSRAHTGKPQLRLS